MLDRWIDAHHDLVAVVGMLIIIVNTVRVTWRAKAQ
jgi:hypothetical protein